MKLLKLTMNNFMPYKGDVSIAFPQDDIKNVMVVFGDNMRGKTSLLNAFRWCFYGIALGRHLRSIPRHDLLNTDAALEGEGSFEVHIQFEHNNHTYDLRRRAQKKSLVVTPTRPEDFEETSGLQKDGIAIRTDLIEAEINQIAPEQVSRFFLFDGELLQEYERLLIEGDENGQKIKAAIEQVLGVPALINGRDELQTLQRAAEKQQNRDIRHVDGLEKQAERQAMLQEKQQSLDTDLVALRKRFDDTTLERKTLEDEIRAVEAVHQARVELDHLEKRQKQITDGQKEHRTSRQMLAREVWRDILDAKISLRRQHLYDQHQQMTSQISRRSAIETKIAQAKEFLATSTCPTCGQSMHAERREKIGTELGDLEGELRSVHVDDDGLTRVSSELHALNKLKSSGAGARIRTIDTELRRMAVELTKVDNDVEELRRKLEGHDTAEIARKRTLRDHLVREEGRLETAIADRQTKLDENRRDLAVIAKALQALPEARRSRSTVAVKVYSALEKAFSDSIERLRDDLRQRVQEFASQAFKSMTTQQAYKGLVINSNYGLTIVDDTNRTVPARSAGAEQVVALSLIDGLTRTGHAAGPVIMDTPFGRLDPRHRENILRFVPTTTKQLVLLVHEGEIRKEDLATLSDRIGVVYEIQEINARQSRIVKVAR